MTNREKLALVDHEFEHVKEAQNKHGETFLKMVGHDLEEFSAIVQRHGLWDADLKRFFEEIAQLDLFSDDGAVAQLVDAATEKATGSNGANDLDFLDPGAEAPQEAEAA